MSNKKHFETVPEPIKYTVEKVCCKNGHCKPKNGIDQLIERSFNSGAKQQLETILEKYVLIPRWKDGKRPE